MEERCVSTFLKISSSSTFPILSVSSLDFASKISYKAREIFRSLTTLTDFVKFVLVT